jgi:hypothetical protein
MLMALATRSFLMTAIRTPQFHLTTVSPPAPARVTTTDVSAMPVAGDTASQQQLRTQGRSRQVSLRRQAAAAPKLRFAPLLAAGFAGGLTAAAALTEGKNKVGTQMDFKQPPMLMLNGDETLPTSSIVNALKNFALVETFHPQRWPEDEVCHVTENPPPPLFGKYPLYRPDALPHPFDIVQKKLSNHWLLAPLGSLAQQCPDLVASSIRVSADGTFVRARLFDKHGKPGWITVTEQDIQENIRRAGGSQLGDLKGNAADGSEPVAAWVAVMEAAASNAFMGREHGGKKTAEDYERGYAVLGDTNHMALGTQILTGQKVTQIDFQHFKQLPGANKQERIDKVYDMLNEATKPGGGCMAVVQIGREENVAVTAEKRALGMAVRGAKDGIAGDQAYIVAGVHIDENGEKAVFLRSPFGAVLNDDVEENQPGHQIRNWVWPHGFARSGEWEGPVASKTLSALYDAGTVSLQADTSNEGGGSFYAMDRYLPKG